MLRISVITAVRDRADMIQGALNSVAQQTYPYVEHVLIDGASTDGTLEKLRAYQNPQCILLSEQDTGIYNALNKGIALATGDVIGVLHSDDFFASSECLQAIADAFSDPTVDVVYGDLEYVSKHDIARIVRRWRAGRFKTLRLSFGWMPPHPTIFVRRRVFERIGVYNEHYRIAADYEFVLRCFGTSEVHAVYIDRTLVKMRTGGESNRSINKILFKSKEDFLALRSTGRSPAQSIFALICKNVRKVHQFWAWS